MARVFITRELPGRALEMLQGAGHDIDQWPGELPPSPAELREHLAESEAVIGLLTDDFSPEVLDAAPRLRAIANMSVGYDNVDPAEAAARGIWVTNTPGVLAETTADFAFALLMASARRLVESVDHARAGHWKTWSPTAFLGSDVYGATLGIVGLGEIGGAVARRAKGFGMRVLTHTRTPQTRLELALEVERVSLDELLAESDFVSLHTPLTPATRGLMGNNQFATMKPGAILINTARGAVVDQAALVGALRSGRLGGAALDVTDPEPLPPDHPLYSFPNVIITPHVASASQATRSRMAEMAAANIIAVLEGREPPNAVNQPG